MLGVYDKGRLQYVGHIGTGFSEALLKDLLES
jgi:ATP-dependent DNA ligase